jgi:hypothetical protein
MACQADVLEHWWQAGWRPFGIDGTQTLTAIGKEFGTTPPTIDAAFLKQVVGNQGF